MRVSSLFSLVLLVPLWVGCTGVESLDSASGAPGCGPNGCFNNDAASDAGASDVSTDIGNDAVSESGSLANPLCGVLMCNPDDDEAVKCNAPAAPDGGGTDGGGGFEDGGEPDGDTEASMAPDAQHDADAAPEGGDAASMGGSMGGAKEPSDQPAPNDAPGADPPSDDEDVHGFACQVTVDEYGDRVTMCMEAGSGVHNDPCVASSDCAAGFACVGDQTAGVCRAYCCLEPEACAAGTYCGVKASRDALQDNPDAPFLLPVCVPADDCELLPGPDGTNRCADGLMCAIVRSDGTTACVEPGTAGDGAACESVGAGYSPCAEGFVCSKATNTCLKLCRIGAPETCDGGVCQGGTGGIPDEYGVCVGARD